MRTGKEADPLQAALRMLARRPYSVAEMRRALEKKFGSGAPARNALARLRELARAQRCAVMCSEAVWWRCHRRIIADYLVHAGEAVFHIIGAKRVEPARMTPSARPGADDALTYRADA